MTALHVVTELSVFITLAPDLPHSDPEALADYSADFFKRRLSFPDGFCSHCFA